MAYLPCIHQEPNTRHAYAGQGKVWITKLYIEHKYTSHICFFFCPFFFFFFFFLLRLHLKKKHSKFKKKYLLLKGKEVILVDKEFVVLMFEFLLI